jgi:DNA ligase (NAD+)
LTGLGIHGVGSQVTQALTDHYHRIEDIIDAPLEELQEIEGIGPQIAHDIVHFFERPRHRDLLAKLARYGVRLEDRAPPEESPTPLEDLVFVITGTLPTLSREAASELITQHGGRVTGSVSAKTSYLVAGDKPGGTKVSAAQRLGTPIIDEEELRRLIGQPQEPPVASEGQPRGQGSLGL